MPKIGIDYKKLITRGESIRKMLKPLVKRPSSPSWKPISASTRYIIGAYDGGPIQSDYRTWRFATIANDFRAMYFEIWLPFHSDYWYLEKAYLTIYHTIDRFGLEELEYISLHCDPNEPAEAQHSVYKQGPHLHISAAQEPIPRAHIALNRCHLKETLLTVDSLSTAISTAILMLREEILDDLS